jgi:hypothetical protein
MNAFVLRLAALVTGILSGFDRLVFRGHLRQLSYGHGMNCYLSANHILLKDFGQHSQEVTAQLLDASLAQARQAGREIRYLPSSRLRKEDIARDIAQRDRIRDGLICVLKCVEPCLSFEVHRDRDRQKLELQPRQRKCLHLYHYYQHPTFGFMHARIQTWFPFPIQVCLNGREWLARQLDQAGLAYRRRDNCFTWLADPEQTQTLFDQQLRAAWPELLAGLRQQVHPSHPGILGRLPVDYYWSVHQSEWASDVMFRRRADLETLYPPLVRHALTTYDSAAVLRFLGRRVPASGQVQGKFDGEVSSEARRRVEGVRVKHQVNDNAVKMYDKGSVLRIETTINQVRDFKVYRTKENEPEGELAWRVLRKGVADLQRRATVSQACNERYAAALAAVATTTPLRVWAEPLCRRVPGPGPQGAKRLVRGLNPLSAADRRLLEAVSRPEFLINGLRNRDLVALLCGSGERDAAQRRRQSAWVTRQLRLLRAHGLLHKVANSHRYLVSPQGRQAITALLAAGAANTDTLTSNAA